MTGMTLKNTETTEMTAKDERIVGLVLLLVFYFAAISTLNADIKMGEASYEAGTVALASARYEE